MALSGLQLSTADVDGGYHIWESTMILYNIILGWVIF